MFSQLRNEIAAANAWFNRMLPAWMVAIHDEQMSLIRRRAGRFVGRAAG
jgi:hypothetical protein